MGRFFFFFTYQVFTIPSKYKDAGGLISIPFVSFKTSTNLFSN